MSDPISFAFSSGCVPVQSDLYPARPAHVIAFRRDKSICHTAADHDDIRFFHQVGNHLDFVTDLSPADNGRKRTLRIFNNTVEEIYFLLQ